MLPLLYFEDERQHAKPYLAGIYMFKVNDRNTRTSCDMFKVNNKDTRTTLATQVTNV